MKEPQTYAEAVGFLEMLPFFSSKNKPGNMVHLLRLLGNPEKTFRVVHVAGTNGKGSTCAFLESIFRRQGLRTGLFTSPHLVSTRERIRVNAEMISEEGFLESLLQVRQAVKRLKEEGGLEPTYFEHMFAISLVWFRKCGIDLLVSETGLGGRLDATNTIEKTDAAVITSVSLDHTEYLGDTVEKIAREKAGIIRENTPVIYRAKDPGVCRVLSECARLKHAEELPLTDGMFRFTYQEEGNLLVELTPGEAEPLLLKVPFAAGYQAENACLAALCAMRLGVDRGIIQSGIESAGLPGRMQEIRKDVFLDGAHNPDGIRQLAVEIRRIAKTRPVRLVIAVVSDKNHSEMVRELCGAADYEEIIVTSVGGSRQLDARVLAEEFRVAGQKHVEVEPEPADAYQRALQEREGSVLICTGSLYLVGEILALEPGHNRAASAPGKPEHKAVL